MTAGYDRGRRICCPCPTCETWPADTLLDEGTEDERYGYVCPSYRDDVSDRHCRGCIR